MSYHSDFNIILYQLFILLIAEKMTSSDCALLSLDCAKVKR
jgi:hypothetical protein